MACFPRSIARRAMVALCLLTSAGSCVVAQTPTPAQTLLPKKFAGWSQIATERTGTIPVQLDAANADVLTEYGLKDFAEASYRHGGAKVDIHALHFVDATGAYGAFAFYRKPDMKPLAIGKGAAGNAHEVVFWTGTNMVDAVFPAGNGSASFLKALAEALPPTVGSGGVPPTLPDYLPLNSLDRMTIRYAIGPAAYAKGGGVLPPDVIPFSRDAEAVTAQYSTAGRHGTLTLLEFPTPQMAAQAQKAISALLKQPLPGPLKQSNPEALKVRRAGPLVAVTSGQFSAGEAQALLEQLKYQANVTWNQPSRGESEIRKAASMLIGIAYLTVILAACALLLGFFLGGGRAIWRVMRGKPASSLYEQDFISLNLSDWQRR